MIRGRAEVIELIVEATKPDREVGHDGVPKLTSEQFKQVYDEGMKRAGSIAKEKRLMASDATYNRNSLINTQSACSKLVKVSGVNADDHRSTAAKNTRNFDINYPRSGLNR